MELPTNASYHDLVGDLFYVTVNTRPSICVSISLFGRKVANPTNRDWIEAKKVLRYLKAAKNHRLHLGSGSSETKCFVDDDWAGDEDDRKSHSGFLLKFGGGLFDWGTRSAVYVVSEVAKRSQAIITQSDHHLGRQSIVHKDRRVRVPLIRSTPTLRISSSSRELSNLAICLQISWRRTS